MQNESRMKINKNFLTQQVYDIIKTQIIENEIKPNQKLSVADIAQKLGVSRTPVAAALKALENDGYVNIMPQYGTFVRELTPYEIEIVYRFRAALEPLICEIAIKNADRDKLQEFKRRFLEFNNVENFDLNSLRELFKVDVEFHRFLDSYLPEIVRKSYTNMCDLTKRSRFLNLEYEYETYPASYIKEKNVDAHVGIIDAILNNDLETSCALALKDLNYTKSNVLEYIYPHKVYAANTHKAVEKD